MASLDIKKLAAHLTEDNGTVVVTTDSFSTLPQTVVNDAIRAEHVVVNEMLTNPSAQVADWKVVTSDGSLLIDVDKASPTAADRTAAISGTTAITLYLNPTTSGGKAGTTVITSDSFSSLPKTITDDAISPNHVVIKSVLSNPSAQTADWKVDTSTGSLTIDVDELNPTTAQRTAAISGSTTITLYLTIQTA